MSPNVRWLYYLWPFERIMPLKCFFLNVNILQVDALFSGSNITSVCSSNQTGLSSIFDIKYSSCGGLTCVAFHLVSEFASLQH